MGDFKVKSELIPVTAGDSHLSKKETLGFELCRRVLAEPFKFLWERGEVRWVVSWEFCLFLIFIKMPNRKQLLTSVVCSSQNKVLLVLEEGALKWYPKALPEPAEPFPLKDHLH